MQVDQAPASGAVGTAPPVAGPIQTVGFREDSRSRRVYRSLSRNVGALLGLAIVILCLLLALVGPLLTTYDPVEQSLSDVYLVPSLAHPLGTDELGRDTLTRLIHGSRITL